MSVTISRGEPTALLSRIVKHADVVYLAGQTPDDTSASTRIQTEEVLAKIDTCLAAAGSDKSKLLTALIFVSDIAKKAEVNEAWLVWVDPRNLPARACVAAGLDGGADVEIIVSAAV